MSTDIHLLWCHDPNYLSVAAPWFIYKLEWEPVITGFLDTPTMVRALTPSDSNRNVQYVIYMGLHVNAMKYYVKLSNMK